MLTEPHHVRRRLPILSESGQAGPALDRKALERALRGAVAGEIRFDDGYRAVYSTDAANYRFPPVGVVLPRSVDDVVEAVRICRAFGAPILSRGGGTSLAGQSANAGVVIDWSKYLNRVLHVDPERRLALVQPGTILDHLRSRAERHELTFGPDPATHDHCTLGGMIGNNSCGVHAQMNGKVERNVSRLEILTYDGVRMWVGPTSQEQFDAIVRAGGRRAAIYRELKSLADRYADRIRARFPDIPRRVSGYNLDQLLPEKGFNLARALVGTESTCVTVLEAELELVHSPPCRNLLVLGYPDAYRAADHVPEIVPHGPLGLEGIDSYLLESLRIKGERLGNLKLLPQGGGFLLVEFGGETMEEADEKAREVMRQLGRKSDAPDMRLYSRPEEAEKIWQIRESGLGVTAHVPGRQDTWPGWEDSAVPPEKLGSYLRDLRALLDEHGYHCSLYGHFGQGCVHCRIDFDLESREGIAGYRRFVEEAADLVCSYGGSLSGEHGDGQARGELLERMYGRELVQAFEAFKRIWDPDGGMNPGKVVHPYGLDENLRLGADFRQRSWQPQTHFAYREDRGSFLDATLRCVGVGQCRRTEGGTMCPSYMVTREEVHSTRGRARILFEMLQGDITKATWRNEAVKEALDLCLACKGCKGECPVNVDMATYKAEFLSHYYEGRLRPLTAYAMGLIMYWAQVAKWAPGLANLVAGARPSAAILERLAGVAQQRSIPRFAPLTFQAWWRCRQVVNEGSEQVLLWPDTFSNHFQPEVAQSAVAGLEAAGYRVVVPTAFVCCGRPLYDYGMLATARHQLRDTLRTLTPFVDRGVPVVGLEPSCVSTFRDELPNLLPDDPRAKRLAEQTFTFAEFLQKQPRWQPPRLEREALVHGHCHEKSVLDFDRGPQLLERMGVQVEQPDTGCCGMAGSFGYEKEKYEVSVACGERVLLPAVRQAPAEKLVVADGFSCRSQIEQGSGRRALHTAQVVQMALQQGPAGPTSQGGLTSVHRQALRRRRARTLAAVGVTALAGSLLWRATRR